MLENNGGVCLSVSSSGDVGLLELMESKVTLGSQKLWCHERVPPFCHCHRAYSVRRVKVKTRTLAREWTSGMRLLYHGLNICPGPIEF
jgi:hypothetical protein